MTLTRVYAERPTSPRSAAQVLMQPASFSALTSFGISAGILPSMISLSAEGHLTLPGIMTGQESFDFEVTLRAVDPNGLLFLNNLDQDFTGGLFFCSYFSPLIRILSFQLCI